MTNNGPAMRAAFASLAVEEVRNFKAKLAQLDQIRHDIRRGYQKRLRLSA